MSTDAFNTREFRDALSSFATGVTVVTCLDSNGAPVGATASSFNSVSMDPPLILWSITKAAYSADAFINAKHFVVNVLSAEGPGLVFYRGAYATAEAIPTFSSVETNDVGHFLDDYLLYYMTRATHQMGEEFHQLVADDGLTTKEWRVLASLYNENSMSLADLAKSTMVDQATLLELAMDLQKHNMARVQQLDAGTKVTGTTAGKNRVEHLIEDTRKVEKNALEGLDSDAADTLKTILKGIIQNTD